MTTEAELLPALAWLREETGDGSRAHTGALAGVMGPRVVYLALLSIASLRVCRWCWTCLRRRM